MAKFIDPLVEITGLTKDGGWYSKDLSSYGVPPDAIAAVLAIKTDVSWATDIGVRMPGSTDEPYNTISNGYWNTLYAGVHDQAFEYCIMDYGGTGSKLYLAGWLIGDDGVFFTNWVDQTGYTDNYWSLMDCSASVPEGAVAIVLYMSQEWGSSCLVGARHPDSTQSIVNYPTEFNFVICPVNAAREYDVLSTAAYNYVRLIGYLTRGTFFVDWPRRDPTGTTNWEDVSLAGDVPPQYCSGAVMHIRQYQYPDTYQFGIRKNGSSDNYEGSCYELTSWCVPVSQADPVIEEKHSDAGIQFYLVGFLVNPPPLEEALITIVSDASGQDDMPLESLVTIQSQIQVWDNWEVSEVDIQTVVQAWWNYECEMVTGVGVVTEEDYQHYLDEATDVWKAIVKTLETLPQAPMVKGRSPKPGETAVLINQRVCFYVQPTVDGGDPVDITTVTVQIGATVYDYQDAQFFYSGTPNQYYVEVGHPDFTLESPVNVKINASSVMGQAMTEVSYSFTTEWDDALTRPLPGMIEIFESLNYDYDILTLQEDFVRQGVERFTLPMELWYGRYQRLPFIENLEMRLVAGATNAQGKEIIDNGYLSVKIGNGSWVPCLPDTVFDLGPMYSHSKKDLYFKLMIPEGAQTTKYFVVQILFECELYFPYGRFAWSRAMYSDAGATVELSPSLHLYRAYVFNNEMWTRLQMAGILPYVTYRGEDMQW